MLGFRSRLALACLLAGLLAGPLGAEDLPDVNGAAAEAVQSLQQRMLADPAIAAALASGDMAALLTNPKLRRLADDPAVQHLTREVER